MAMITYLSDDVITIILEDENISLENIMNFKTTCKRFQEMTLSNKFWERKYYQSCPTAKKKCNKKKQKKIVHNIDFKETIKAGLHYIQMLQHYTILMSENKLCDSDKEQLEGLLRSIAENTMMYYFVWDEISRISAEKSCKLFSNLTLEYYFKLIFYYLKQYRYIYKQMKFMNKPETKFLLEKQFMIVVKHFQPHVSYSAVKTWLDEIAQTVLSRLMEKYPAHSIFSATSEQFSFWRDNNIHDNFWNETESKQIMCILKEYIYSELEIHQLLLTLDLEAKYIKYISGCFRIYLLTVTYHIVARRLGIHCILRIYGIVIIVIWKPKYDTNNWDNVEYFCMPQISNPLYPLEIIRGRHTNNEHFLMKPLEYIWITRELVIIYRIKLECYHNIYCKWNFKIFNFLAQYLMTDIEDINIEIEYKNITSTIEARSNAEEKSLKIRTEEVKFAVGMIVSHTWRDSYTHNGVIIGWQRKCDRKFRDKLDESIMLPYLRQCPDHYHICECNQVSTRAHHLHYIILSEINGVCFVRQDQLSMCPPKEIDNIEIGRFFSNFEGTYYVPNESLRRRYPNDTAAIAEILTKQ
ncbi:uncharacterized protein LOC126855586 [Cataglyphis hispanica]|uniref:uncharacterized protein LOC126855586 n=1 Tax=Cataglyphis hispanica TaxID=1086592 RepID=UPI0021804E8C|nr:uncharacterized protein LOC126855586 [Cataglyphis hispanica]